MNQPAPPNGAPQPQQIQVPEPVPLPTVVDVSAVQLADGNKWVRWTIYDVSGVRVVFLPPDAAEEIGRNTVSMARTARSGLIIPGR